VIDRRAFLGTLTGGLLAAPLAAVAQQAGKVPRIGVLSPAPRQGSLGFPALLEGLRDLGYEEGKNIVFEYRWPEGQRADLAAAAAALVHLKVDAIVTADPPTTVAAKHATSEIPIVFAVSPDPVGQGLVASLARPGGNVTGLAIFGTEFSGKRLELFREMLPGVSRIALLWDPQLSYHPSLLQATEEAARHLSVSLQRIEATGPHDIERAFQVAMKGRAGALLALPAAEFGRIEALIAEFGLKYRMPTMTTEPGFAKAGGLVQYGPSVVENWRRVATYVDKILKGAKPADLPVEQPTKFELVINLKTAKALGLTIPSSLLQRADEVIQ